jgi:phosphoribosylformimino-5-aminoimidazole carboxamide ribotide isomerase
MTQARLIVIPAVDVLGEEAVRLEQGDYARVALRAGGPLELVSRLAAERPALIHLVDLDGARSGRVRPELVEAAVAAASGVPIQASGGIRSPADAEALLAAGAARVVVGTAAWDGLDRFVAALGERLVVAIDVRDGAVAVSGWTRTTALTAEEAAQRCAAAGVARILCTAVERDGTLGGPDLALLARVQEHAGAPMLAAGGIRSEADLDALAAIGVEGAVVGRALLDGSLPLHTVAAS